MTTTTDAARLGIRIPPVLADQLRLAAYQYRTSQNAIVIAALEAYLPALIPATPEKERGQ